MWWLYFFIKFIIWVLLLTLACVPALLLLFKSGIVNDSMCWWVYNTPTKANMSADLAESIPYTWTSCEEKKWDVGKERVSMDRANNVIILGRVKYVLGIDTQHQRKREIATSYGQRL